MIWFTSDLHFHHKKILHFCPGRAQTLEEMHEALIRNWNARVHKRDRVYVLGDFSFGNKEETAAVLKRLHGQKVLIKGNHDREARWMLEAGFYEVLENHYIRLRDANGEEHKVYLSHFPYYPTLLGWLRHVLFGGYWDTRHLHKRIVDEGYFLLHGHTHSKNKIRGRMIHVGVDAWDLCPVPHTAILDMIRRSKPQWSFSAIFTGALIRFRRFCFKSQKNSENESL